MKADPKTKRLAVTTGSGNIIICTCDTLSSTIKHVTEITSTQEIPAVSIDLLLRGENLFVVGFANGMVKIISP
jgi:hypothetical protein